MCCEARCRLEARFANLARAERARLVVSDTALGVLEACSIARPGDVLVRCRLSDWLPPRCGCGVAVGIAEDCEAVSFSAASASACAVLTGVRPADGRLIWLASSLMPLGARVPDIAALAAAAARASAVLIVDNSIATHFACTPLLLGADAVIEVLDAPSSGPLALTHPGAQGSTATLAWSLARRGRGIGRPSALVAWMEAAGAAGLPAQTVAPEAADLTDEELARIGRIVEDAPARAQTRSDHARAIAAYLSCHPRVRAVRYPGLADHVDHATAIRALRHGFGPIIDIDLVEAADAIAVLIGLDRAARAECDRVSAGPRRARAMVPTCGRLLRIKGEGALAARSPTCSDPARRLILTVGTDDALMVVDVFERALAGQYRRT